MPQIKQVYISLHEIESVISELNTLSLQERQDIINLDLTGLAERQGKIEALLARTNDLNRLILSQIGLACDEYNLTGEKTLSRLITVVPKPDRDMYARVQKAVRTGSVAVENEMAINKALLKDSLAFTTYSLQTFTGILKKNSNATYGQQGRFVETIDQPRIICKEI